MQFTAVFRRVPEGYVGFVEELPGANTQAATLDQAQRNLRGGGGAGARSQSLDAGKVGSITMRRTAPP
jgi:hypothetical protein